MIYGRAEHRGLWASWDEGLPASCVSDFLAQHVSAGGVIIGWELHGDLEVIGFEKVGMLLVSLDHESIRETFALADWFAGRSLDAGRDIVPRYER